MNLSIHEIFSPQKTYFPMYLNIGVSFQLMPRFLFVLHTNDCHCLNEIETVGSHGSEQSSAQALVLFPNVAIHGGISVTYFLNTLNISINN